MQAALPAIEPAWHDSSVAEAHPVHRLLEAVDGPPRPAELGGYRFWACAEGPENRPRTTAVWGLWLDHAVVFAADTESVAEGDPRVFPTSLLQLDDDGGTRVLDGEARRVEDPRLLARFVSQCEAKYGFEPDPGDPDTPVYAMTPGNPGPE
ncbi:MAG TPA: hypothetical protein VH391_04575 [Solirubrobacterales bacterium]|jgi:hypothetical protein